MGELNWTTEAEQWLRDIYTFIARDNPAAASKTIHATYENAEVTISRTGIQALSAA
jgi:toxin ParE1/3/4